MTTPRRIQDTVQTSILLIIEIYIIFHKLRLCDSVSFQEGLNLILVQSDMKMQFYRQQLVSRGTG